MKVLNLFRLSALTNFIAQSNRRDSHNNHPGQVIEWWEQRRISYNQAVGFAGIITVILMVSCGLIAEPLVGVPIGVPDPPMLIPVAIVVYGFLANVCYTAGWVTELLVIKLRPDVNAAAFGMHALRYGVKFSMLLTLSPALFSWTALLLSLGLGDRGDRGRW